MGLFNTLQFITSHPLTKQAPWAALARFIRWQLRSRLRNEALICPFVEDTRFLVKRGMTGATGNIYTGLHEFEDMAFLLHFLREEDLFVDVGANVGSYTLLASGVCKSETLAVEPDPGAFETLAENIRLNRLSEKVSALRIGLGDCIGTFAFSVGLDCTNHVLPNNSRQAKHQTIQIRRLDDILNRPPLLLKVDVEGYETAVLAGAAKTLRDPHLTALLIERNGAENRYGFDESEMHRHLRKLGFSPYQYHPFSRKLSPEMSDKSQNTLYLRNIPLVRNRLQSARPITVLEKTI